MNEKQKEIKREIEQLEKQLKNDKDFLKLLKVCEKAGDEVAIQCGVMITEEELAQTICDVDWDKIPAITKSKNKRIALKAKIIKCDNGKYICVDNQECFACEAKFEDGDSIKIKDCIAFHVDCLKGAEDENQ